jgi:large subunit ribosomal protein L18
VFRSHKHIYAQLIDDVQGTTLLAVSTQSTALPSSAKHGGNMAAAALVGRAIAQRAVESGIARVAFDRGPYKYHGRVAALAQAAREVGLEF